VIVIGGGPAGSTAATMLSRKGWRVLLLERERFPREHIGESLLPASLPILEDLGAMPAVEAAGFLRKWGAVMVWGRGDAPWSWYFRETNRRHPYAFQVWRAQFDQILLENSARQGVDVRQGCRVLQVRFEQERATGVRYLDENGAEVSAQASFVVDASGQTGLLGRALALRRADSYFRNLAVYGYFTGAEPVPTPDESNIFIESYADGWCWTIPLHSGWTSVGIVVDSGRGGEALRREGSEAYLRRQIGETAYTAQRLRNAALAHGPVVVRDWSYVSDEVAGDGYVLAGDAACFVDPLFSSGVHLALTSGVLAAAYVTSALKDPGMREAAGRVYKELYYKQYGHFRELAKLFYTSNRTIDSYFWEARRILGMDESVSPREAFVQAVAGQPTHGYERAVIDRGAAPDEFIAAVRAVEEVRDARRTELQLRFAAGDGAGLSSMVPRLAPGARLERKPVLGDGEFEWGYVLTTLARPDGAPLSPLVAKTVSLVDGRRTVGDLLAELGAALPGVPTEQLAAAILPALQILYVDGAVAALEPNGEAGR
jgi:flavin-dependent dehydrogenase